MRKVLGIGLVLVGMLLLVPFQAAACRTCDDVSFWSPNCALGCSYCAACTICCGGDPNAGGNCTTFCGGGGDQFSPGAGQSSTQIVFQPADTSSEIPAFLADRSSDRCSPALP
jgi:hypothetical protein